MLILDMRIFQRRILYDTIYPSISLYYKPIIIFTALPIQRDLFYRLNLANTANLIHELNLSRIWLFKYFWQIVIFTNCLTWCLFHVCHSMRVSGRQLFFISIFVWMFRSKAWTVIIFGMALYQICIGICMYDWTVQMH